jgi:hypothetical protein
MDRYAILLQYFNNYNNYNDHPIRDWLAHSPVGWILILIAAVYIPLICRAVVKNLRG